MTSWTELDQMNVNVVSLWSSVNLCVAAAYNGVLLERQWLCNCDDEPHSSEIWRKYSRFITALITMFFNITVLIYMGSNIINRKIHKGKNTD